MQLKMRWGIILVILVLSQAENVTYWEEKPVIMFEGKGDIDQFNVSTYAIEKSRERTATDIYSTEDSSLHSDPEYKDRAKFTV